MVKEMSLTLQGNGTLSGEDGTINLLYCEGNLTVATSHAGVTVDPSDAHALMGFLANVMSHAQAGAGPSPL